MHLRLAFTVAALGLALVAARAPARADDAQVATEIHALVSDPGGDSLASPMARFYAARAFAPVWVRRKMARIRATSSRGLKGLGR